MLSGGRRIPPRDMLSLSYSGMQPEAHVVLSAASGRIQGLSMAGSHTGSTKQTGKQREQGERTEILGYWGTNFQLLDHCQNVINVP